VSRATRRVSVPPHRAAGNLLAARRSRRVRAPVIRVDGRPRGPCARTTVPRGAPYATRPRQGSSEEQISRHANPEGRGRYRGRRSFTSAVEAVNSVDRIPALHRNAKGSSGIAGQPADDRGAQHAVVGDRSAGIDAQKKPDTPTNSVDQTLRPLAVDGVRRYRSTTPASTSSSMNRASPPIYCVATRAVRGARASRITPPAAIGRRTRW
jgi:hypothetical protein